MTKRKLVFCSYETLVSGCWLTGWPDARTMVPGDAKRTKPHAHTQKTADLHWTERVVCNMPQTVTPSQLAFQLGRIAGWAIDS
jgi:hypothetical protein